ncbi:MAG: hypothetical protein K0B37_09640 [Bacteroidales bacterium]|nr:hypothetical protein [Bacteroidales bacterium]
MNCNTIWKFVLPVLFFATVSCGPRTQPAEDLTETPPGLFDSETHQVFFNNLASLCGQSFMGEQVYRSHHGESWADRTMIMYVTVCEDDHIHIPFHVDDDHSRTWMFLAEDGKLRFRHQHLHEDGTHEEGSMYGGFADENGTAFVQYFPADEYTAGVIEDGGGNLWTVSMDEEFTMFSYRLDRDGEKRFEIVFDLTNPILQ